MKANALKPGNWRIALAVLCLATQVGADDAAVLTTKNEKDGYAIGADLARNLKRQGVQVELDPLLRGMRDVFSGNKLLMTDDAIRETIRAYQVELKKKLIQPGGGAAGVAPDDQEKGAAFLQQNKTNPGVICLPSGLQYKILKAGNGQKPSATDTIECHFRGTLIDGQQFAGSDAAGTPATFKISDVIPGWKEALQLMPVGSKWQLFIPPQLAYGDQGAGRSKRGPKIGPNTTLIYELELLAIK